jgi:hypothetical protein
MPSRPAALRIVLLALLAGGAIAAPLAAQTAGADGPVVLRTRSSVRSAGFNGAGAALMGDPSAVFYNPAGLALISHVALEAGYFSAPLGAYQTVGAIGVRLAQFNLGFGVKYFDFGSEPELVPDPATGGITGTPTGATVDAREILGAGSLIYRFGLIALGGTGKVVQQRVAGLEAHGVSADLGLAIAVFDIMALGFSVQNVSGNWDRTSTMVLPRLTRAGFTMNYVDPQETWRLMSTLEMQWPEGRGARFVFGVEGGVVVHGLGILGRSAYGSREPDADASRFTYGLSLTLSRLTVDYAYEPTDLLGGGSQRIGLRLGL